MAVDPRNLDAALAEKDRRRRNQMIANEPIIHRINPDTGKVRVWHLHERRWKDLWPVDAVEQIGAGLVAVDVTLMQGPAGEIMVPTDEIEEYRLRGYRMPGEPQPEQPPESGAESPEGVAPLTDGLPQETTFPVREPRRNGSRGRGNDAL
jgi:hypothetical protein